MVTDPSNSILGDPQTTFEAASTEVKDRVDALVTEDTQEAKDEMFSIAKDHGVAVTPNMTSKQIQDSIHDVM